MREEPALAFWLSYAQRHGALVEEGSGSALVLLPEALQAQAELPEEVTVTASPELGREEAAALLIAGHPAVERAATAVLSEGTRVAAAYLPLLRVGAMVSYTASLTLCFQEQEHVLLDARSGLEPPRKLSALAQRRPLARASRRPRQAAARRRGGHPRHRARVDCGASGGAGGGAGRRVWLTSGCLDLRQARVALTLWRPWRTFAPCAAWFCARYSRS